MAEQHIPGPGGLAVISNALKFRENPLEYMRQLSQDYGDVVSLRMGPLQAYLVNDPELFHEILVKQWDKFYKSQRAKALLKKFLGNGLGFSEGDFWRRQRRLMQPAFHRSHLQSYADWMVDAAERMVERWEDGGTYDMYMEMMRVTQAIVVKTLFDADGIDATDEAVKAIDLVETLIGERLKSPLALPDWVPTGRRRQERDTIAHLNSIIMSIIEERRRTGSQGRDLLSMLIAAVDEDDGSQMTNEQLRDEVMTLFAAGHETTATGLAWTWYLLGEHPEVEAKLRAEIDEVLGTRRASLEDLPRLPYTEMVFKEATRLYPPIYMFFRDPIEDVEVGGYRFPKGSSIFLSTYVTQRDGRYFENPEAFIPERFAEGQERFPKHAYITFGGGPRYCLGSSFAMMEAKLILATALQHYDLQLVPGQDIRPEPFITLRPKHGIMMAARQRIPSPAAAH